MLTADTWESSQYELLDTSDGEKLERFGGYILRRPDPQAIWQTPKSHPGWKHPDGYYHRSAQGGGSWEFHGLPGEWSIRFAAEQTAPAGSAPDAASAQPHAGDLVFRLKPFAFKHTGIFPEQAANWLWFMPLIRAAAKDKPVSVLNLFAYTGGATIACARAGASVVHVDAAKGMVQWAKENAAASGLSDAPIRYLVDDCVKFVEREIRRGHRYDAIILDPPSYGRGPKGETWKLEERLYPLLQRLALLLAEKPLFFLLNSYTTGLQPAVLHYLMHTVLDASYEAEVIADEIGLPVKETGLVLPCGASCRVRFLS